MFCFGRGRVGGCRGLLNTVNCTIHVHTAIGAAMLRGQGRLFAYDIDQARLRHLEAGAKRVGLSVGRRCGLADMLLIDGG